MSTQEFRELAKQNKAKQMMYKRAIVAGLTVDAILDELYEIQEVCADVHWFTDCDDDTLINALSGDEDQAFEFRMMFADLETDVGRLQEYLSQEYVPDCFGDFFTSAKVAGFGGGLMGWDDYQGDYFPLESYQWDRAAAESQKRLERMTKAQLIEAAGQCCRVLFQYIGLRYRYDCLKASMDILREQNTGYLDLLKKIEQTYEMAAEEDFIAWKPETKALKELVNQIPDAAWIQ